jgi:ATP-dependent DNA helicase RecG
VNLIDLLREPEGKSLEFKRDLSGRAGILRTVVAFANTAGGTLVIGVDDDTREVRGVSQPIDAEETLANVISDGVAPRLVPEIEVLPWRNTHLLAVRLFPSGARPHHLTNEGPESGVYVRVGSSNRRADQALREELRRYSRGETYDEQPLPDLDSEALDFRVASELFAPRRVLTPTDLESLRMLTLHQGRLVPTVGGMLLVGRNRERYFPDAWIQAGRFSGIDRTNISDRAEYHQPPPVAVEAAIGFVQKHNEVAAEIGSVHREDRWKLPPTAVREALINAVVHADYAQIGGPIRVALFDDRLEIENPGLLPFGLTVEDMRRGVSRLRNRVIGRVFNELGLIEQWGSGIQRMTAACNDAGLPEPMLEEMGARFRVTISTIPVARPRIDPLDRQILELLAENDGLSTAQLARLIARSARATRTRLQSLIERGLVTTIASSSQDPGRRYYARQLSLW